MEKIIFFALAFPIIGFVFYLGGSAIMKGFKAKDDNIKEKYENEIENIPSSNDQLSEEITKANQYADEAQEAKKMSKPHNIGAILFFLPGAGLTMKNVEEAAIAARDRALHLNKLKEKKGC